LRAQIRKTNILERIKAFIVNPGRRFVAPQDEGTFFKGEIERRDRDEKRTYAA
jgi:hypothetical protein